MESEIQTIVDNLLTHRPIDNLNRRYLGYLKHIKKYEAVNIFDIGSAWGAYSKYCNLLYPDAKTYLFEADSFYESKYSNMNYNIVCLGEEDDKEVKFYNNSANENNPEVHSCYKSVVLKDDFILLKTKKLDTLVIEKNLPIPDIVKISCNGSELDIIKGGLETIKFCTYLIVKIQNYELFEGAPVADVIGPYILGLGFTLEQVLDCYGNRIVDYVFKNKNI
jgi:FkbM family methyltransferase